ncbi:hypothetical protein [Bacillus mycoides]|uniref:hypothetical protein n=1 Tax=Bacillus mycoides TaxID=1405 RepID=UPI0024AD4F28|nr:hypothetical protein [Bacillus mycoides]MDI6535163.1 hypothetical protein [Bacillus mycoides]
MTVEQIKSKIEAHGKAVEKAQAAKTAMQESKGKYSDLYIHEKIYGSGRGIANPLEGTLQYNLDVAMDRTEIDNLIEETRHSLNTDYAAKEYQGVDSSLELLKWNKAQVLGQRLAAMWKDSPSQLRTDGHAALESNSADTLAYVAALDALGRHLDAQNLEQKYKDANRSSGQTAVLANIYQLDNLEKEWNGNTGAQLMAAKLAKYQ